MSTATYKNLAGFSAEKIALLERDFAGLNESGSDLAERAVRYVIDGEDANVLDALAKAHEPAHQLRLIRNLRTYQACRRDDGARDEFFANVEAVGHEPYLRLAKIYEAAAKGGPPVQLPFQAYYGGLAWLELFLQELHARESKPAQRSFPLPLIEEMLAAEGQDPALLMKAVFSAEPQNEYRVLPVTVIKSLPGFRESVLKGRDLVADALLCGDASRKIELLGILSEYSISPEPFVRELVSLATSNAKTVREATVPLLNRVREQARPFFEDIACQGTPTQRIAAHRWLGRYVGLDANVFLLDRQQGEKNAKVQQAIAEALSEIAQQPQATQGCDPVPLSPVPSIQKVIPLAPAAREAVMRLVEASNRAAQIQNEQIANHRQKNPTTRLRNRPIYDESHVEEVYALVETMGEATSFVRDEPFLPLILDDGVPDSLSAIARHPDIHLIHLLRLLVLTAHISIPSWGRLTIRRAEPLLRDFEAHHSPRFTLPELAACIEAIGLDGDVIGHEILGQGGFRWAADSFEAYLVERLPLLERALDNRPLDGTFKAEWRYTRKRALETLANFRQIPSSLAGRLWNLEFTATSDDRLAVEKVLPKLPDQRQRLADALADGNYQTRLKAAELISRSGDKQAAVLLRTALSTEKQDGAKDAMLTALERLGESIEPFINRDQLLVEAQRGLKKGHHKDLAWFPVNSWPEVHWCDSEELVPVEVFNWFLERTNKLASPESGAVLRRYCRQFADEDREAFGVFVLKMWIEQDVRRKYSDAQARQLAKQQAQRIYPLAQQYSQRTLPEWENYFFHALSVECVGSAIKQKGILALAAACCGDEAVKIVGEYLKQWYGYRAAQCRALVAMLASLDRPAAIQLLLSVANRFRTKSIREEAEKYVKLVAERKGWTIDELADRTVPTVGFDETLALELDYGPRQLTARLLPDFTIELADENGKPLKSLPEPRKDDDAEKAKAAKKTLSTAKSELKKLVAQQIARLYEAMCTERTWSYADWDAYLYQHPIVRRLCQRLVWGVLDGERLAKTFRPLDDGTLTDENDEQVVVPADARLRLAHGSLVPAETSAAWTQHFADYEVEPLFTQFGRDRYVLPNEKQDASELADFEGHLIEAFKLRGHATRLGYTRGPAQDGGWFYEYEKTLAGMGLKVVLCFSGNGMPEENRTVALMGLHFSPSGGEQAGMFDQPGMPLREVPGVLLSECYHDLATIAAAGSGYDAEWQKKVEL